MRWLQDAVQAATRTVPIVALFPEDPVANDQIASLARPGGNLTGVTGTTGPEFFGKRLQLLQHLAPRISRAAFLGARGVLDEFRSATLPAGVTVVPSRSRSPSNLTRPSTILREGADALMVASTGVTYQHSARIVTFASESRLPAIYGTREPVDAGGLMSYGPSAQGIYRQMASTVDKYLRGAKIGELPTEQPTTFELIINAKTARSLGLTIDPNLLTLADEVIE